MGTTCKSIEAIKVCGITYSDNEELAYEINIAEKNTKLENQIKRWLWRELSLERNKLCYINIIIKCFVHRLIWLGEENPKLLFCEWHTKQAMRACF